MEYKVLYIKKIPDIYTILCEKSGLELIRYMFEADHYGFLLVAAIIYSFLAAAFIRLNFGSPV